MLSNHSGDTGINIPEKIVSAPLAKENNVSSPVYCPLIPTNQPPNQTSGMGGVVALGIAGFFTAKLDGDARNGVGRKRQNGLMHAILPPFFQSITKHSLSKSVSSTKTLFTSR